MADEKIKISELESAIQSEFTDDALLALDVEDQNSATGYSTKSGLLSRFVAYIKTKLGIADLPTETIASDDLLVFADVSDSNKPKSTTAAAVAGLALDGAFKIDTFTSSNYSIAANGTAHMAIDFITVPSGYTLAGIVGFATNQAAVGVSVMRLTKTGSWALQLFNTSSSSLSGQPFEVTVLFIKSSLLS